MDFEFVLSIVVFGVVLVTAAMMNKWWVVGISVLFLLVALRGDFP